MPTYLYQCDKCGDLWDVVKSISEIEAAELCAKCHTQGQRRISRFSFTGAADWNTQTYNPALGCYTRNNAHARQLARNRGYEEIGTEPPEKIHSYFEKKREEIREERWRNADRDKLHD